MSRRAGLPLRITLLLGLVLIVTVLSALRFVTAIGWRATLDPYVPDALVLYSALSGAFWALAGLFVLWAFHRRVRRLRWLMVGAAAAYAAWSWADRLLVQSSLRANWPFDLFVTLVLLAFVAAVVLDPRNQSYFRKGTYDRKPEEPRTA